MKKPGHLDVPADLVLAVPAGFLGEEAGDEHGPVAVVQHSVSNTECGEEEEVSVDEEGSQVGEIDEELPLEIVSDSVYN